MCVALIGVEIAALIGVVIAVLIARLPPFI